jgi:hypothetical protein
MTSLVASLGQVERGAPSKTTDAVHIDADTRIHNYLHIDAVQLLTTAQMWKMGFLHMCPCASGTFCTHVLQISRMSMITMCLCVNMYLLVLYVSLCDCVVNDSMNE